jgi:peptidoglycan hydrolase-like protein with peptidoglycan-binding domain
MPTFPDRTRSVFNEPRANTRRPGRLTAMAIASATLAAAVAVIGVGSSPAGAVGPTIPKRTTATTAPAKAKGSSAKASTAKKSTVKRSAAKTTVRRASTGGATATRKSTASGLGTGARGAAVIELQELLAERHYDVPEADGNYGGGTYHAVMAVQKAWGLPRTGRATTAVLDQLRSGEDPEPIVPNGGLTRVEIDLPRQALFLYIDGSLVKILSISSGNNERFCEPDPDQGGKVVCDVAKTPGGSFRVNNRILGFRESRLGAMFNPMYFNGGIAMHGSQSVPASPASHGCVRVTMASSERLFEQVQIGTPVYVFDGKTIPKPLADRSRPTTTTTTTTTTLPGTVPGTPPATTLPGSSVPPTSIDPATTTTAVTVPGATTTTLVTGDTTTTTVQATTTVPPTTVTSTTTIAVIDTTTTTSTIPILPVR